MTQSTTSRTLFVGMDVHKESIAVAYRPQLGTTAQTF